MTSKTIREVIITRRIGTGIGHYPHPPCRIWRSASGAGEMGDVAQNVWFWVPASDAVLIRLERTLGVQHDDGGIEGAFCRRSRMRSAWDERAGRCPGETHRGCGQSPTELPGRVSVSAELRSISSIWSRTGCSRATTRPGHGGLVRGKIRSPPGGADPPGLSALIEAESAPESACDSGSAWTSLTTAAESR